jgi:hypothetical protein
VNEPLIRLFHASDTERNGTYNETGYKLLINYNRARYSVRRKCFAIFSLPLM